jgi:hypothetical protein
MATASSSSSSLCHPEKDPFLLLESTFPAVLEILLRHRGQPLRRSWLDRPYGEKRKSRSWKRKSFLGTGNPWKAADNYRQLRSRGITVRKTIGGIIATAWIEANLPLLFSDRDFMPYVEHLGLAAA